MTSDEKVKTLETLKGFLDMSYECETERLTGWDLPGYKYHIKVEGGYVEIRICLSVNEVRSYAIADVNGVRYSFDIFTMSCSISPEMILFGANGMMIGFRTV